MQSESIGEALKRLRIEKGFIRQAHLAEKLKVSAATISRIEKGKHIPSPDTMNQLARVLDVPLDYLLMLCGYNIDFQFTAQEKLLIQSLRMYEDMRYDILKDPQEVLAKVYKTYKTWNS